MLRGEFAEGQNREHAVVSLEEVDPVVLEAALRWVYTDEVNPDTEPDFLFQVH